MPAPSSHASARGPQIRPVQIEARGWGWRHAGRHNQAVSRLDLRIEPGERVLLLGASGAGKSTLVHALAGVLGDAEDGDETGSLLIDGRRAAAARGRVGLVLQDPDSQVVLARVGDDVAFGCENLAVPRAEIWPRVRRALAEVGLNLPLDHPTSSLSGGQKQRLALAGVLAMQPGLLLLDEPTANLDPVGVIEVRDAVVRSLDHSGATLVVIEHRVEVWQDVVDRVIVLDPTGGALADGPTREILAIQGERLAQAGVWVPALPPRFPVRHPISNPQSLLRAEGLAVGRVPFGRRAASVVADGITLSVDAGRATVVTGPNGAGKSTLVLTLAGLLKPAGGTLRASDSLAAGIPAEPHRWRSRQLLTRIGAVFQDPEHQFLAATVRGDLTIGPHALGLSPAEQTSRVDELMHRLRLDYLADANPFTLSGGEKRRMSVATVLATRPRLLVLDEPTFGQDSRTWQELVGLLAELLDEGTAIVAVTHDAQFVSALADEEYRLGTPITLGVAKP
ncbi:energy-coupling factor transport system ATP-binding protein [Cryobacterium flavum]|uniref:ABC transporter ATP-binding protein n=1 Tax=Cryobacterium flavum TaxID=1424659 RepID=A0A4R8VI64_9MICO|nr:MULTISPECIES: ABC transporter ATP-binding protein [Cryobacterium]TFB82154.1 ABC transporter ATP-binding protein [Cryobacterium flavum]SDN89555.1 energy-coupling factor transport system ATP-binding protein [Cryobacterium flavum]